MKFPRVLMAALLGVLALSLSPPAWSQCPVKTTVSDTLFNADGALAAGRVMISWPTFQAGSCQVVAGQTTIAVTDGAFSVGLYPNDAAVPAGTSYRVAYYLKSGRVTTEYWVVPSSATPVNLAAVRSSSVPMPTVMFSQSQVTNLLSDLSRRVELPSPCPAGKFLQASGSASPPQVSCVDGTGAPLASSTQSGTVKTDVTETDPLVYTRATADLLLAGKASAAHTHAAADTMSGVFDPARLPAPGAATLGGIRSGTCSGTDKVTGVSAAGAITCGADQSGGGSSTQHQVNGTNLAANDPVNFQDSATIAFTNPSTGNVQSALKDGSVSAAKLAVASPTGVQLSGVGDVNIPAGALSPNRTSGTAEVLTNKNAANGYAGLDAGSRFAKAQAPSTTVYTDASNTWSTGTQDMSGAGATLPVKTSTTLPGSCTANKELFIDTDATAGKQLFICNGAGNGWNLVGDGVTTTTEYLEWAMACQGTSASHPFDAPAANAPAAACLTGTNTIRGVLDFDAATDESVQGNFQLPPDWTGNIDLSVRWQAAATSGDVVWGLQTACVAVGETGDPAFNAAQTVTDTAQGTANQFNDATISTVTVTGCAAGEQFFFKFYRDADNASDTMTGDGRLIWLRFTLRRAQ